MKGLQENMFPKIEGKTLTFAGLKLGMISIHGVWNVKEEVKCPYVLLYRKYS